MAEPKPASEVKATAEDAGLSEHQVQLRRAGRAVRARKVRREALKRVGAVGPGEGDKSGDLAADLDANRERLRQEAVERFKQKRAARAAVAAKLAEKRGR